MNAKSFHVRHTVKYRHDDNIQFQFNELDVQSDFKLTIINSSGQILYSKQLNKSAESILLNKNTLKSGVYVAALKSSILNIKKKIFIK